MRPLLLAVRFLAELALLAALAYWGFTLDANLAVRLMAGIGAPGIAILVWDRWVAPRAARQLQDPSRFALETVLFAAASLALVQAGQPVLGIVLVAVYLVDRVLLTATGGTGL